MKIDGSNPLPETQPPALRRVKGPGAEEFHEVGGTPESDGASLSNGVVSQLAAKVQQMPDIRQDRVEALRQAVQSGQYQVSDQQIADAIGANLLGMGPSK